MTRPDPIFALIEAHREAARAQRTVSAYVMGLAKKLPKEVAREHNHLLSASGRARAEMLGTIPSTPEGLAALAQHLWADTHDSVEFDEHDTVSYCALNQLRDVVLAFAGAFRFGQIGPQ